MLQKLEGELKNLEDFADSSSVKMDERAQKQSGDVIPPPVERKLLDLVPPTQSGYVNPIGTNTIATSSKDAVVKPGPPEGTKYLAKKAAAEAAEVAKAKAAKAAIAKQAAEVAKAKAAKAPPVIAKKQRAPGPELAPSAGPMTTATPAPNTTITPKQVTTTPENNNAEYFAALNTQPTTNSKPARLSVHDQKKRRSDRLAAKTQPAWNSSTKIGGFLSSKKYSHKRRNRKLKSQKRAKLMKRKSKAHKKKASTRRR